MMLRRILLFIFWLALLNILAFFVATMNLGGDAWNGRIVDSHYFLGMGGRYTEVSEAVYRYSHWQDLTLLFTQPLGLISAVILWGRKRRKISN
jgi:hypothetical protein